MVVLKKLEYYSYVQSRHFHHPHSSSLLFFAVLIRDDDSVMNSRLDEEDTKQQSPDFFSSEDSNTSFEDDVSDGSSVPLFVALRLVGASAERISIRM